MKINHLPTFEVTLPLSKDVVKFRPFVMKEEKLLLMAAESKSILNSCSKVSRSGVPLLPMNLSVKESRLCVLKFFIAFSFVFKV